MKTKTKKTPEVVAGEGYKEIEAGLVDCDKIAVISNFRKTFNEKALQELAENIAKVGVLQPVILREGYILVAGERRYRAAMLAGVERIPYRMLELTEDQALEVQALENLHRKDLSPIEEARAFKVLLDQKGHSVEQAQELADRVGKNVSYVYRAVRLLELPEKVLERIESGEWTAAHGHQLLRVPAEKIEEVVEDSGDGDETTATNLKDTIDNQFGRKLDGHPFPKNVAYAGKEACTACVYNSGNQGRLFDGAEKGNCLNRPCLEAKMEHYKEIKIQAMKNVHGDDFLGMTERYVYADCQMKHLFQNGDKNLVTLGKADDKKTKAAQKAGAKYLLDSEYNLWVVVERKPKTDVSGAPEDTNRITPKQKFIRMETYKALFNAARTACLGNTDNSHLAVIAKALEPGHYDTKIPMQLIPVSTKEKKDKENDWTYTEYQYEDLSQQDLFALVFMMALDFRKSLSTQEPDPKSFSICGINAKAVMAKAKKDAEAAWDAQKGKKPAKAAK
jgi:ParB/RepB/Spo0J family partition protein